VLGREPSHSRGDSDSRVRRRSTCRPVAEWSTLVHPEFRRCVHHTQPASASTVTKQFFCTAGRNPHQRLTVILSCLPSRGESRNLRKGAVPLFPVATFSLPSSPLPLSASSSVPLPSHLEVGTLKPARGSGERCKRKRISCTLELLESHWWQSF